MTTPDPYSFPQAWDQITIGNVVWGGPTGLFGKIKIVGATRFYKIDQKDGQGLDGATQTYRGQKPKPFRLEFTWGFTNLAGATPTAQHEYWVFFSYQFNYTGSKPGLPPPVFQVYHPALALLGISAILVEEVGAVEINDDSKLARSVVVVRQFYPPPPLPATSTPIGAPPSAAGAAGATGINPLAAENVATQAQIATVNALIALGTTPGAPHP